MMIQSQWYLRYVYLVFNLLKVWYTQKSHMFCDRSHLLLLVFNILILFLKVNARNASRLPAESVRWAEYYSRSVNWKTPIMWSWKRCGMMVRFYVCWLLRNYRFSTNQQLEDVHYIYIYICKFIGGKRNRRVKPTLEFNVIK